MRIFTNYKLLFLIFFAFNLFRVNGQGPRLNTVSYYALNGCTGNTMNRPRIDYFEIDGNNLKSTVFATATNGIELSSDGVNYSQKVSFTISSSSYQKMIIYLKNDSSLKAGTYKGEIKITSSGADSAIVSVVSTLEQSPSLTIGKVYSVIPGATFFSIPYTTDSIRVDHIIVEAAEPNPMPNYYNLWTDGTTLYTSPTSVGIPISKIGNYNFTVYTYSRNGLGFNRLECASKKIPFVLSINYPPSISSDKNLIYENKCAGSAIHYSSFTVTGNYLNEDIKVSTPANIQISLDGVSFSTNLTLVQQSGSVSPTTIYVKPVYPTGSMSVSGMIVLSSGGTADHNISYSSVLKPKPTLSIGQINKITTDNQSFSIPYSFSGSVNKYHINSSNPNPLNGFNNVDSILSPGSVKVALPNTMAGIYNFEMNIYGDSSNGCSSSNVPLTLTILPGKPQITINTDSIRLISCLYQTSNPVSFVVNGTNLSGNLTLAAPYGVVLSTDSINFSGTLILNPNSGSIQSSIFAKLNSSIPVSGSLSLSSKNAITKYVPVSSNCNLPAINTVSPGKIIISPNPIHGKNFNIVMSNFNSGDYVLEVVSVTSNVIYHKAIKLNSGNNSLGINLQKNPLSGIYTLRVIDRYNKKAVVQFIVSNN